MIKRILTVAAVAIAMVPVGCRPAGVKAPPTAIVKRGPLVATVSTAGTVERPSTVNLVFQASGQVQQVLAHEGEAVQAGQVIASLDTSDAELQVAIAEANLAIAQAQLEQVKKGPAAEDVAAARASLLSAQKALQRLQAGPTAEDIELARLSYEQAKDQLWGAQGQRDATAGNPMASAAAKAQAEASVASAEMAVEMARIRYEQAQKGATAEQLAAAEAQVSQAQAALAKLLNMPSAEDVRVAEARVRQAEVSLRQAQAAADKLHLKAPFAGVITRLDLTVGQYVGPGSGAAVILAGSGSLRIQADMSEIDIARVQVGMPVEISLDALPGQVYAGQVTRVASAGTSTQGVVNYPVTIEFQQDDESIRPGMTANATIVVERRENVLLVPNRAIRSQNGQRVVRVLRDGQEVPVVVQIGLSGEGQTEILDGVLQEGDVVLLSSGTDSLPPMGGAQGRN
ncbi:MAG: efflux RND transporter periplasmic adaptor subunit [Anaerolineae bacterium]